MFDWFKRERPPADVAAPLVGLVLGSMPSGAPFDGVDATAFRLRMACATAFAVDFAMYNALGDTSRKQAIAEAFWSLLTQEQFAGSDVAAEAMRSIPRFATAISNPGPKGFSYEVGKVVAEDCGAKDDPRVILLGARMFVTVLGEAKKMLAAK